MSVKNSASRQLPHLPLDEYASHITQDVADRAIDHLVEHFPERIAKIADYERGHTDASTIPAYAEAIGVLVGDLGKALGVPNCELSYIELNFELVRRFRAACGFSLPKVKGKPLAPSINGPYPEKLADKPLRASTLEAGFTTEQVNSWVGEFYQDNKTVCYEYAEAWRREVASTYLQNKNLSYLFFMKKAERTGKANLVKNYSKPAIELADRIRLTCEII